MIIFYIVVYMLIAWISTRFIYFVVNETWNRGYTCSETDKKCAALCGIVWPVTLPVIVVVAIGTIIVNLFAKGLK